MTHLPVAADGRAASPPRPGPDAYGSRRRPGAGQIRCGLASFGDDTSRRHRLCIASRFRLDRVVPADVGPEGNGRGSPAPWTASRDRPHPLVPVPPPRSRSSPSIPLLPRWFDAVRRSERYGTPRRISGAAKPHTTVSDTKESGTLVAYLHDVGPLGLGKPVGHAPDTFHGRTPGKPFPVDLELFSTAYDVPAGHRPAPVVDTVDPLCIEHNPSGARLTFSSPATDPSYMCRSRCASSDLRPAPSRARLYELPPGSGGRATHTRSMTTSLNSISGSTAIRCSAPISVVSRSAQTIQPGKALHDPTRTG
ncbi:hypothetical protein SSP531S_40590 [Streptomyces spongiicola]|uniref:Xaa-Pro dipeptidyl-peptidase C-terminal domain-containing protein n=1 Tax=Streptomyces spongiicola TaxID=1690221 RepID=A0A388T3M3_9ACTN|nr:hypothetical protein SSP531S_40590 [Streptomyces spongiicola]